MNAIGPKSLELPTQVVLSLLDFAGRAPLLRPEWVFLEEWEGNIKRAIVAVQQQNQAAAQAASQSTPAATPKQEPFDPTTARAERKREQRRERRLAETQGKVRPVVGGGAPDASDETPTA